MRVTGRSPEGRGRCCRGTGRSDRPVPCTFRTETATKRFASARMGRAASSTCPTPTPPHCPFSIFTQGEHSQNGSGKIKPCRG